MDASSSNESAVVRKTLKYRPIPKAIIPIIISTMPAYGARLGMKSPIKKPIMNWH